jgi:hypothetical protein
MKKPCGCCGGIEVITPVPEYNRPGLPSIAYRVGAYGAFRESMLARLSSISIDLAEAGRPDAISRVYPLEALTTREPSDPSIALLDAWAIVADVLAFYQERIANEGYLITAKERLSVVELARLIGYRPRPGVSASVFLAFSVTSDFTGSIPAGTRAQSIPGSGETAQYFETSSALAARFGWNDLSPRLTRPQVISPPPAPALQLDNHLGTNADVLDSLYFRGVATNLKAGDGILLVLGDQSHQQFLRFAETVELQADAGRTLVTLREEPLSPSGDLPHIVAQALQRFIDDADHQFPGSDLAARAAALLAAVPTDPDTADATAAYLRGLLPQIQALHDIAKTRDFSRLQAWLGHMEDSVTTLLSALAEFTGSEGARPATPSFAVSSLERLGALLPALATERSVPPTNPQRLVRSATASFSSRSDNMPRLIAALHPVARPLIYDAWGKVQPARIQLDIHATRAKAGLFASSFAGLSQFDRTNRKTTFVPATLNNTWGDILPTNASSLSILALDAVYDKITPNSWIAVSRPVREAGSPKQLSTGRKITYHFVTDAQAASLDTTTGYTAKATVLTLDSPWLIGTKTETFSDLIASPLILRGTIVYAQTERLDLAEEPLDRDVSGDRIELDGLYDGLEPGKWLIVKGERTDIPGVTGVASSELVMVSAVTQGAGKDACLPFLPTFIPLAGLAYISDANAAGDRLVVGSPCDGLADLLKQLPTPGSPNQQFCEAVQLSPGVYADAYVPTADERNGGFGAFAGQLIDPFASPPLPFPGGNIPAARLADTFAWRIRRLTSGSETVHTTIQLASPLAYAYGSKDIAIHGNVVKATHGQTTGEILGDGDASQAFERFTLHQKPLTYLPAATPAGAESTLSVRVNEIEWHEASDLVGLSPTDRQYVTGTDDTDQATVIFGNGEHGARVPTGSANVKATYRYGIGRAGNVQAARISQLSTHPLGLQGVINPLPATGGADRDTLEQARRNAPLAVLALDRLVSVQDYADFARSYAGIGKASAARISDGRRQVVHLTIAGAGDIPIDQSSDLYQNLLLSLRTFGDPSVPVQVCIRRVKLLVMIAGVKLEPDYLWEAVEPKIRAAVYARFAFDARDLGQPAFLSEAIAAIQSIEGVLYVDAQAFDSVSEDTTVEELSKLAATLAPHPFVPADLARLDPSADPAGDPCARIRPAELAFLTPDVPDALFLTQIGA